MENRGIKTFLALSLAGLFVPLSGQTTNDNTSEPDKNVVVGTAVSGDTLTGNIVTTGQNSKTTVTFLGSSSMNGGTIKAEVTTKAAGSAVNEVHLENNSVLNLGTTTENNITYSIFASGSGAKNTISDITTGSTSGTIAGAIYAKSGGVNTIFNLRNHAVSGPIIADGEGSVNNVKFDSGTTFKSYIAALSGGTNVIQFNNGAKFESGTTETTYKATILADGGTTNSKTSSNTITGTTTDAGTISGNIVAINKGTNTITLTGLQVTGDVIARANGSNIINLTNGYLTNIRTQGDKSKNTINLNGTASIKGFITNSETTTDIEGTNTITLNDSSTLDLNGEKNTDNSAIFTSKSVTNTISGNSTGSHKIKGNITAQSTGTNTITLSNLAMTGNINADGGKNVIKLGLTGGTTTSNITGNITAKNGNYTPANGNADAKDATTGLNNMELINVDITGNISAESQGQNILNLKGVTVTGNATSKTSGNNHLILGNGSSTAKFTGKIEAQANGSNTIEFNNGEANGGIYATGANAKNTITLGNSAYRGTVKSNITADNSGTNAISIQQVDLTGSIIAQNSGTNTITDDSTSNAPSTITGRIEAKDNGTNTATLKNITITEGIIAGGTGAKNVLTLGDKENGVITSSITANAQGTNVITFKNNLTLSGNITANSNGTNTISEDSTTTTQSLIQGKIDANGGTNAIILANAKVSNGIIAQSSGKNTITVSNATTTYALIADITAQSGGINEATLGDTTNGTVKIGNLEGNISASGDGSKNTFTLNNASTISKGSLFANASDNSNATSTNTITLNGTSSVALQGAVDENGLVGYAIWANGLGAKNTITDNTTNGTTSTITGSITADNNKTTATDKVTKAQNVLTLKNLTLTGSVNAYQGGDNTLTLTTATITGNVLAKDSSTNNITFSTSAVATMSGTFAVESGGVNTITLNDKATFSVTSNNNPQAFQASGQNSKNILQEINAANTTSGSITGQIFAQKQGTNEIKMRFLDIDGDITSWGGTNTIEIGSTTASTKTTGSIKGHISANSNMVIEEGNMNSTNTITLNGSATLAGSIEAQGTTADTKSQNTLTLKDTSSITLTGISVSDKDGTAIGSGNDAILAVTQKAYNKIEDNGSGSHTITGNIYAANNSVDAGQINNVLSGNEVTLKKVTMTGNVIADVNGKNVINFGTGEGATLVGNISATSNGTNTVVFGATGKTSSITGNVSATNTATNTITLTDTSMNATAGTSYSIQATTSLTSATTNTLTLNGSSSIANTALLAIQTATAGITASANSAQNTITLSGTSSVSLAKNAGAEDADSAILASGLFASNTITDSATGANTITGNIKATGTSAKNTITLKNITMAGDIIADNSGENTITFAATSGTLTGDISASNKSKNTITFGSTTNGVTRKIDGNVTATTVSTNTFTLDNTTMNSAAGANFVILASATATDAGTTSNTLTLNNASSLQNTAISAIQAVTIGPSNTITSSTPVKNEITLNGTSYISLVANKTNTGSTDYDASPAILASGIYSSNTITDNGTGSNTITGDILANYGEAQNIITLKKVTMTGSIIADNNASNTITFGNGTGSGTFYGNIAAYTRHSESKNTVSFSGMTVGGNEVRGIIAQNDSTKAGGTNAITLKDTSTLTNMYMSSTGTKSTNTITLSDAASSISLSANTADGNAMYAKDSESTNKIATASGVTSTASHSITGNITAEESGANNVSLGNLTIKGNISADNATNTIAITTKGSIDKTTITASSGGTNTLTELKETTLSGTLIKAVNEKSTNSISFTDKYTITLTATSVDAILADNSGSNTIQGGTEQINATNNSISGNITASNSGTNTITLNNLTLTGDINASALGTNTLKLGETGKTTTITGNVSADNATNTMSVTDGTQTGNISALSYTAKNSLDYKGSSELKNSIILAQGADVSNALSLTGTAKITGSSLQAIKTGEVPDNGNDNTTTVSTAANTITLSDTDTTFTLVNSKDTKAAAVYASGEGTSNTIKSQGTKGGTVEGNIIALDGGKNDLTQVTNLSITSGYVNANGGSAINKITITNTTKDGSNVLTLTANSADGAAVSATTAANTIALTDGNHTITGNIGAYDGGVNTITFSDTKTNTTGLAITGDILSSGSGAKNVITLEGASSITATTIEAKDSSVNTTTFQKNASGTGTIMPTGVFTVTNNEGSAVLASGWQATNILVNPNATTASTISGNIVSLDGGINTIEAVTYLTITNATIEAKGDSSNNSIVLSDSSSMTLKSNIDKNALYATGFDAKNTIKDNGTPKAQNTITGNMNAAKGAANTLTFLYLKITGNLIATDSGNNTLTIGPATATANAANKLESSFTGAIIASGSSSVNILTAQSGVTLALTKDDTTNNNAVYVSGLNSKNTVTDNSGKTSKVTGDIYAQSKGENDLTFKEVDITGDVYAYSGGKNTITIKSKGSIEPKDPAVTEIYTQKVVANGASSLNVLNYNSTSISGATIIADNGGENRMFLTLQNPAEDKVLKFDITTGTDAINKFAAVNLKKSQARVTYTGGTTTVVLSQATTTTTVTGGDITASSYTDGVLLSLDGVTANAIFKDFRDLQSFYTNLTTFSMESTTAYSLTGNYVGSINFLQNKANGTNTSSATLTLEKNASLIAKLYTNSAGSLTLTMKQGSKWMVTPEKSGSGVVLSKLAGSDLTTERAGPKDALREEATIVDLATGGYATKYGVSKSEFTALTLNDTSNLNGTNFRVFADVINRKSDTIHVLKNTDNSGSKSVYLQAYYTTDSLRKAGQYSYDDTENSANNTLVATVESDAKNNFQFDISQPSTVEQGYLLVTTEFVKKEEASSPLNKNSPTTTAGATATGKVDNYYIKGYSVKINPEEENNSYGIVSVNYLVWLANSNNINKRLGEVRDSNYSHGLWMRSYGGQIMQDRGISVTNNYISTQIGYDFGFAMKDGMQFIGFAFGYGYNDLKSSQWRMQSNYLSGALYYSYVKDSGFYSDTIARYEYIDTTPLNLDDLKTNMQTTVLTLSQELGYRAYFDKKRRFFFEGQIEGIGGYMIGSSVLQTRSSLAEAQIKSSMPNSLVLRGITGGVFGYRLFTRKNQTDFRIGASYVVDYALGAMSLNVGDGIATDSKDLGFNQMVVATLGVNTMLTENLRMYFDLEMGFLGKTINQNYLANVGIRYTFGTKKRESNYSDVTTEETPDFKTINIEAPRIRCAGCNPESAFYLEVVKLPRASAAVANYISRYDYRAYTQSNGQVTYFIGPFRNIEEVKAKQAEVNKLVQALMRNPNVKAEIYKVNNKARN